MSKTKKRRSKTKKRRHQELCSHYKRRCYLHPPCCKPGTFYPCRVCHDEMSGHEIGLHRFEISEIKCASCDHIQEVGSSCKLCGESFGDYFCRDCRLWSSDREIYHCNGCKLCRNGRREAWKHCDTCNVCYQTDYYQAHVCSKNKLETTCPICWEYMFDSRRQVSFMPCGHPIHEDCLDTMIVERDQLTCPSCRTLIIQVQDPVIESRHADGSPQRIRLAWPSVNLHVNSFVKYSSLTADEFLNARRIKCRKCATGFPSLKQLVKHHTEKHSPEVPKLQKKTLVAKILARLKLKEEQGERRIVSASAFTSDISIQLNSVKKVGGPIERVSPLLEGSELPTTRGNLGLDSDLGLAPEEAEDSGEDFELKIGN